MKTTLLITTYNRPEYLRQCLDSVKRLAEMPDAIFIIDDCSTDSETRRIIADFEVHVPTLKYFASINYGIKHSLSLGCEFAFANGADLVINLDGDAIIKPDFIIRLKHLHLEHPGHIVSGFNSLNKDGKGLLRNPIIEEHSDHYIKKHANGINMCFNGGQYESHIKPALIKKQGNWDYDSTNSNGFVVAKPSLVQHIGIVSSMGHTDDPDVAADFFELSLPSVGLFGIDAHDPSGLNRAAEICLRSVEFGDKKIITQRLFEGREAYSKFMIKDLWSHVKDMNCTHVLTIHPDGFIVNPSAWRKDWLQYDYIGATWVYKDGMNVGNGGFSLRSKRFIEACGSLDIDQYHPEDCILSRRCRPFLESVGMRWAPEEVANAFSIEAYSANMTDADGRRANAYSGSFGFHGYNVVGLPVQPAERPGLTPQGATKRTIPNPRIPQTFRRR